jgi:hypothetical protein
MTTQHTPTPWEQFADCGPAIFKMGTTQQIATTAHFGPDKTVHATDEANARFIVEACNAHAANVARIAELEAALRGLLPFVDYVADNGNDVADACAQVARAALGGAK